MPYEERLHKWNGDWDYCIAHERCLINNVAPALPSMIRPLTSSLQLSKALPVTILNLSTRPIRSQASRQTCIFLLYGVFYLLCFVFR